MVRLVSQAVLTFVRVGLLTKRSILDTIRVGERRETMAREITITLTIRFRRKPKKVKLARR